MLLNSIIVHTIYLRFTLGSVNSKRIDKYKKLNIHNARVGPCLIKRRSILLKNNGKFAIVYVSTLRKRSTADIICKLSSPNLCYWVNDYWLETDLRHRIPARYQPFSDNTHVCKVYSDWLIKSWVQHSKSCARDK